jgi:hypothetical protein
MLSKTATSGGQCLTEPAGFAIQSPFRICLLTVENVEDLCQVIPVCS